MKLNQIGGRHKPRYDYNHSHEFVNKSGLISDSEAGIPIFGPDSESEVFPMRRILRLAISGLALAFWLASPNSAAAVDGRSDTSFAAGKSINLPHTGLSIGNAWAAVCDKAAHGTPDGFIVRTKPGKVETVKLPIRGEGFWTVGYGASSGSITVIDTRDDSLIDGTPILVVSLSMTTAGEGKVVFAKRTSTKASVPVAETRTVNFLSR